MDDSLNGCRPPGTPLGGLEVKPEDVARLSPLTSKHFHMPGRYHFHASEAVLRGELRPPRDPEKMDDELLIA